MSPLLSSKAKGLLLLVLVAPAGATLAASWHFAREKSALQAQAAALRADQASQQAHLAELDRRRQAAQEQLAQARTDRAAAEKAPPPPSNRTSSNPAGGRPGFTVNAGAPETVSRAPSALRPDGRPPEPAGSRGNVYFPELFGDAPYARLYLTLQELSIEQRYAALFAELATAQVSAAEVTRLRETLARRQMANEEVDGILENQALREKKPLDRQEAARIKSQMRTTMDREMTADFSPETIAQWRAFENGIAAQQEFLDRLTARLSYSSAPLAPSQAAQLVVLRRTTASRSAPPGPFLSLSEEFLAAAASVLQPVQMEGLHEIKAELDIIRSGANSQIRTIPTVARPLPPQ